MSSEPNHNRQKNHRHQTPATEAIKSKAKKKQNTISYLSLAKWRKKIDYKKQRKKAKQKRKTAEYHIVTPNCEKEFS